MSRSRSVFGIPITSIAGIRPGSREEIDRRAHVLEVLVAVQNDQHGITRVADVVVRRAVHLIGAHLAHALRANLESLTDDDRFANGRGLRRAEVR